MARPSPRYIALCDPAEPARPRYLAYYEWGEAGETIFCVHGLTRNALDFEYLAQALAPRYRIISVDMAGRGNSNWLARRSDYNYSLYVGDCLALLSHLGLQKVTWIATSMGGIIGMMIAAMPHNPIQRMVLNDIGAIVQHSGLKRIAGYIGKAAPLAGKEEAMARLKTVMESFGPQTPQEWEFLFSISMKPLPDGTYASAYDPAIAEAFKAALATEEGGRDIDLGAFWNAVACPALILRGGESDILSRATAQAMCHRAAPTQLVEFPGVGHAPSLLGDSQIRVISDWLA